VTLLDMLLGILGEEGVEVAQRCSKATRFGLDEVQQGQPHSNADRIMGEVADLLAVYEMLQEGQHLPAISGEHKERKKQKVAEFMLYSWQQGRLELPVCPECGRELRFREGHPELLECGRCPFYGSLGGCAE
jgi:ribosomal protein S27AE